MYQQLRVRLRDLLDPDELRLLDNLNNIASEQPRRDGGSLGPDRSHIMEQALSMADSLVNVIDHYREEVLLEKSFLEAFPRWKRNRKECIKKLSKIAKSLDRDRYRFNISKMFGYCLSISGGAILVASGVSSSLSTDVSGLAIAGGTAAVAGSLAVLGLSIAESTRLRSRVKKAKILLREDNKHIQGIRDRLNRISELQEALQSVLDLSVNKDIADGLRKFVKVAVKIKNNHKKLKTIERHVKGVITTLCEESSDVPVAAIITMVQVAVTLVFLLSKTENRFVFDFVSLSAKSVVVVASLVEHSLGLFNVAGLLKTGSAAAAGIAIGTVGMALDAVGIVKTSVDILRDSRSPEARKITQATAHLDEEVVRLERVYMLLRASQNPNVPSAAGASEE